jgi:hypothetical protein
MFLRFRQKWSEAKKGNFSFISFPAIFFLSFCLFSQSSMTMDALSEKVSESPQLEKKVPDFGPDGLKDLTADHRQKYSSSLKARHNYLSDSGRDGTGTTFSKQYLTLPLTQQ